MHVIGYILFVIHCLLWCWAAGGYLEMILPKVVWKAFTNPEFPGWLLVIHWGSVLFASTTFILGYLTQWNKTPLIMCIAYGIMALVCVVETFWYMTSKTKYLAMGAEFATYLVIILLLFRTNYFTTYFSR